MWLAVTACSLAAAMCILSIVSHAHFTRVSPSSTGLAFGFENGAAYWQRELEFSSFQQTPHAWEFKCAWAPSWQIQHTAFRSSMFKSSFALWLPVLLLIPLAALLWRPAALEWWRIFWRRTGCKSCGYSLVGLPDASPCPECGTAPLVISTPQTPAPTA